MACKAILDNYVNGRSPKFYQSLATQFIANHIFD